MDAPRARLPGPGDRVGPFVVERELGRGGMGAVYEATSAATGQRVALKLLLAGLDPLLLERQRREAATVARLDHPGIVRLLEAGVDGVGRRYLAMQLVRGESLHALIARRGPLPPREAAALVAQVARALAHAHERGVLHRDIKPPNVLLEPDGRPLLGDFGLARGEGDARLTATGELLGTPSFMAPEQAAGERGRVDARTDVYGLGATLYALLAGRPPFEGASLVNIVAAVLQRPPEPLTVDPGLAAIVTRCLEKEPAARFESASALAGALDAWLAGARAPRPRAAAWLAGGLGCVALAAVGAWAALRPVAPPSLPAEETPVPPAGGWSAPRPIASRPAAGSTPLAPAPEGPGQLVVEPGREPAALEVYEPWLVEVQAEGYRLRAGPQDRPGVRAPLLYDAGPFTLRAHVDVAVLEPGVPLTLLVELEDGLERRRGRPVRASVSLASEWVDAPEGGRALAHRLWLAFQRGGPERSVAGPTALLRGGRLPLSLSLTYDPDGPTLHARAEGLAVADGLVVDPLPLDGPLPSTWSGGAGASVWLNPTRGGVGAPAPTAPYEYGDVLLRRIELTTTVDDTLGRAPEAADEYRGFGRLGAALLRPGRRRPALGELEELAAWQLTGPGQPPTFPGELRLTRVIAGALEGEPPALVQGGLRELRERFPVYFDHRWASGVAFLPPEVRAALREVVDLARYDLASAERDGSDAEEPDAGPETYGGVHSLRGRRAPRGLRDWPRAALLLDAPEARARAPLAAARAWLHCGDFTGAAALLEPLAHDDLVARRLLGYAWFRLRGFDEATACWRDLPPPAPDDAFGQRVRRLLAGLAAHPR